MNKTKPAVIFVEISLLFGVGYLSYRCGEVVGYIKTINGLSEYFRNSLFSKSNNNKAVITQEDFIF